MKGKNNTSFVNAGNIPRQITTVLALLLFSFSCSADQTSSKDAYFDNSGRDDVLSGGVKMISVSTPKGDFKVWTKRIGNNPSIKVLILHGGPGFTHEYL